MYYRINKCNVGQQLEIIDLDGGSIVDFKIDYNPFQMEIIMDGTVVTPYKALCKHLMQIREHMPSKNLFSTNDEYNEDKINEYLDIIKKLDFIELPNNIQKAVHDAKVFLVRECLL